MLDFVKAMPKRRAICWLGEEELGNSVLGFEEPDPQQVIAILKEQALDPLNH
jgi:hypothetical protein